MSTKKLLAPLLLLTLVAGLLGCSKDDASLGSNSQIFTLKKLFENLATTPQVFMVSAGQTQTITGASGTRITFRPQSFKDASGAIITSGTIKIELVEIYKPNEMIANRVNTVTPTQLLTSGGSVHIKATQGNNEVQANSYKIEFKQPAYSGNPMALFKGAPLSAEDPTIIWGNDTSGTVRNTVKDTASENLFFYAFDTCTSFNWINCDYFYNSPGTKTDVSLVATDSTFNRNNTQVFVVFPAINSVASMYTYNTTTHTFSFGMPGYFIPVGSSIHIVIISAKNNSYYMDVQKNITVTNGMSLNYTPALTTQAGVRDALQNL
ncbi:hypothetical protein [Taibaiella chishuiensis]|uniref:Uncharacterized protein n=1 Tax=Taibaiella chishuiensis TaxID=1434707 RepID=A0A2P8DAQ6_9BACT|nr:hypothetical protein [Taibaiella chishuiensis]PSK94289.1 hypothetical protein B0I18_101444 [Taibaiella chishuiensis]